MDFFPSTPPIELRKVREIIYAKESASDLHRAVAQDMIKSCDRFQRWAETVLAVEHEFLRTRRSHQHTYTYSPIARELLRQLEMKPQDNILEGMSGGINPEQLREILASVGGGSQISPELIGQIAGAVANQILSAQQANSPQTSETRELTPAQKRAETLRRKAEEANAVAPDATGSEG